MEIRTLVGLEEHSASWTQDTCDLLASLDVLQILSSSQSTLEQVLTLNDVCIKQHRMISTTHCLEAVDQT